ncbi:MAG: FbpB family small basic protein [Bacillota bacterium]
MRKTQKKSIKELINQNIQELLKDKQTIERIEKRIDERHEIKK